MTRHKNVSLSQYSHPTTEFEQSYTVLFWSRSSAGINSTQKRTVPLLCDEPCSRNSGVNAAWLKPTRRRTNTYQQHPYYLTLQWHDHTALSYFLLTCLRAKHSTFFAALIFFMSDLYHEDQRDRNKLRTCCTDMKLDKFPVLRYNLSCKDTFHSD